MLKWAVAREDRRSNSTKSLRKRRKLLGSSEANNNNNVSSGRNNIGVCETELIDGYKVTTTKDSNSSPQYCKHRCLVPNINSPGTWNGLKTRPHNIGRKSCTTACTANCSLPPPPPTPTHNTNDGDGSGCDSKSLLYMSLDQLPLAIVKQYERMLQENPGNNNNNSSDPKNSGGGKILPLSKDYSSLPTRTKSLENVSKDSTRTNSTNEIIRQAHNRHLKTSTSLLRTTSLASADKRRKNLAAKYFDFKYSNSLSSSSTTSSTSSNGSRSRGFGGNGNHDNSKKYAAFALSPMKSSTLPRRGKSGIVKINGESVASIAPTANVVPTNRIPPGRPPFKSIHNVANKSTDAFPHDLTDPQFLEKSISFATIPSATSVIPSIRCAKKLTLKRSELRKLERIRNQTERLNRFLKKYYHDCLPNLPEEEDEHYSPEEKSISSVLRTHWTEDRLKEISQNFMLNGESTSSNTSSSSSSSSSGRNSPLSKLICDLESRAIRWRNFKNIGAFLPTPNETSTLLPIIQEDTETSSILSDNNSCRRLPCNNNNVEEFRCSRDSNLDQNCDNLSYTTPTTAQLNPDSELSTEIPVKVNVEDAEGSLVTPAEFGKLKGAEVPLGYESFEKIPTETERASPHPSSSSSSSSLVHHYKDDDEEERNSDSDMPTIVDGNTDSLCFVPQNSSRKTVPVLERLDDEDEDTDHKNANYPSENETRNSHEFLPCEPNSSPTCCTVPNVNVPEPQPQTLTNIKITNNSDIPFSRKDFDGNNEESKSKKRNDEGFICTPLRGHALPFSMTTPLSRRTLKLRTKMTPTQTPKKRLFSPRKLVRKPHVTTAYTGKGEVLIRTYCNGDYVTLHVVQAKNLQTCYRSSWKLGIKISLLPEAEESLTKFESIPVNPHRTWVKIDQKFSFEALPERKVFFTLWKRLEKRHNDPISSTEQDCSESINVKCPFSTMGGRTTFLGWTTLDIGLNKNTQSWFKLRKKKMSTGTCTLSSKPYNNNNQGGGGTTTTDRPNNAITTGTPTTTTTTTANGFISKKGGKQNVNSNHNTHTPSKKGQQQQPHTEIPVISDNNLEMDALLMMNEPRQQLQTSSTMDSGVEDCCSCEPCEPSGPPTMLPPTTTGSDSDLEESDGLGPGCRVTVRMLKSESAGFGFSVVWVSPPRIERLEKNKTADLAGLHIGDLIIGVNGEDVSSVPNTTIYHKMKTTGNEIELDVWRKYPTTTSSHSETCCTRDSSLLRKDTNPSLITNGNYPCPPEPPSSFSSSGSGYSSSRSNGNGNPTTTTMTTTTNMNNNKNNSQCPPRVQPPPVSILKPPPPAPPVCSLPPPTLTSAQPTSTMSSWKIRFNIELLDNEEDDLLKQFFICELKFFRKVVAALDRYLIPAQANHLLSPQEMHLIFAHLIKIITTTKRTLQCVANGASKSDWQLGKILFSTHSDHLSELTAAYSQYGKNLGGSAMVLADKMTLQIFAKFVLETPVPKGHLDMTSLVFAPLEHLRNLCEIADEIVQSSGHWSDIACQLKDCYADIVCETDYMEPISHISMKKNPLLSVRDLEKRIVSTTCQNFKVSEKGRKWLFGSRLFRKESDGSWASVWAFLFTDIIVLTSHTTRDRVFFVKEPPIRLEDVVTLHFNLPRKNENEFRLLFGPELPHQSRLDKLLPLKNRSKKPNQIVLRTSNPQVKSVWKLLLQRQIITLNTRISKSSSSNFSISEFCEKFPDENHSTPIEEEIPGESPGTADKAKEQEVRSGTSTSVTMSSPPDSNLVKCQVHLSDPLKPNQSNSGTPTKCFPTIRGGTTSEWSSPLEISRSGLMGNKSNPNNRTSKSSDDSDQDHKPSRATPAEPIVIEQVKVGKEDGVGVRRNETLLTTKLTTNTETLTESDRKSLTQSQNQSNVRVSENEVNRNANRTGIMTDAKTVNSITNATSPKSASSNNNNNNNESITDLNEDGKCRCEISGNNLDLRTVGGESPSRRLGVGEKRVQLVDAADRRPDVGAVEHNANLPHCHIKTTTKKRTYSPSPLTQTVTPNVLSQPETVVGSEPRETFQGQVQSTSHELSEVTEAEQFKETYNRSVSTEKTQPQLRSSSVESEKLPAYMTNNVKISQPGTKIKTNATLLMKSRNLEQQHQSIPGSPSPSSKQILNNNHNNNKADAAPTVHYSKKENFDEERNETSAVLQNLNIQQLPPAKPIHTDSPIISGFGSERTRRRILCDYKVRRDYPELFGITPRDRRTFIKSLAEKVIADEKVLVAPYYYMTPSPLPIPKHIRNLQLQQQQQQQQQAQVHQKSQPLPPSTTVFSKPKQTEPKAPQRAPAIPLSERGKIQASILAGKEAEWQAHLQKFAEAAAANRMRSCLPRKASQEILEDLLEDESEGPSGLGELTRGQIIQGRQRSPEESSSNDSGISEEMPMDKFKFNKRMSNRVAEIDEALPPKSFSLSRFTSSPSSTSKPATMEVKTSHFPTTSTSSSCTSSSSICKDNPPLVYSPLSVSASPPLHHSKVKVNKPPSVSFYEGGPTTSMETVVALTTTATKADKSTATEEDDIPSISHHIISDKSFNRSLMAQRREAFFLHGQSASLGSPSAVRRMCPVAPVAPAIHESPVKVKISAGNTIQQPQSPARQPLAGCSSVFSGKPWSSYDRVQYARLEKEKTARVERVESSDDSTSSDVASASPAPENENGTTDPSWSSSSSSLTGGYTCSKDGATAASKTYSDLDNPYDREREPQCSSTPPAALIRPIVPAYYHLTRGPEIVVTKDSPPELREDCCDNSEDEREDSDNEEKDSNRSQVFCNGHNSNGNGSSSSKSGGRNSCGSRSSGGGDLLRVESNDSTVENYGDDDDEYNFEEDEDDLSHCSLATINRYGTYESLEKIESEDTVGGLPEFTGTTLPRSKARFTFDDDDEDDVIDEENLFEEDFESDFNFRFPSQIQDNTYSVSRLGPLPPLLEEDFEDDMYDENGSNSNSSPGSSSDKVACGSGALRTAKQEPGLRRDNSFLLARIATMYARSSISPLKILRELWLKKRYREWAYKE